MGETADEIEKHIEHKREDLGANLQELEQKVKSATDWRTQFQRKPWLFVAIAFGGGLIAAVLKNRSGPRELRTGSTACQPCA